MTDTSDFADIAICASMRVLDSLHTINCSMFVSFPSWECLEHAIEELMTQCSTPEHRVLIDTRMFRFVYQRIIDNEFVDEDDIEEIDEQWLSLVDGQIVGGGYNGFMATLTIADNRPTIEFSDICNCGCYFANTGIYRCLGQGGHIVDIFLAEATKE